MHALAHTCTLMAACRNWPWHSWTPRRPLDLVHWQADWDAQWALLQSMPCSASDSAALQGAAAAHAACALLTLAVDKGVPGTHLRDLYLHTVAVWQHYAQVLQCACDAGHATCAPAMDPHTGQYAYAIQLLALGVLLQEDGAIATLVTDVLQEQTDRVLDYLRAAAMELDEASDDIWHASPFGDLRDFLDQYGQVLPDPLLPYLARHYGSAASSATHTPLRRPSAPTDNWWAWEVAALVALYGLDDTLLRNHPHYPADLVDAALAQAGPLDS